MSKLSVVPLGEIIQFQRGFDLPTSQRVEGECPVISSSGFTGTHQEFKCEGENVITGRYGTIGEVYYYNGKCWPLNTSLFVKDFKGNIPQYVYYLLKHVLKVDGKDKSTVPGVDRNVLHMMKVSFQKDLVEQQKIVDVLSVIDKKIGVNNKIKETLQEQASLLYDYWFIQFDFPDENGKPYKNSGGKMVWSDELKREIPYGWMAKTVSDLVSENMRGITPVYNEKKIVPVINQKCIRNNNIIFDEVYWHDSATNYTNNLNLRFMDTLINSMGTGTLGRISPYILPYEAVPHSCVTLLRCKEDISLPCWLYCSIKKLEPVITQRGIGSTGQTSLDNNELSEFYTVLPPFSFMKQFESTVKPIFELIMNNNVENIELKNLRDWLLPMLMNGQATVE